MKISRLLSGLACSLVLLLAAAPVDADGWEYSLTPYLWAVGLDGTVGLGDPAQGGPVVDLDVGFSDLADNLEMTVPLHFEMKAPVWTLLAEVNFAAIGSELGSVPGDADFDMLIAELLAGRQWTETVQILFGSRYHDYDIELNLTPPAPAPSRRFSAGNQWVDPVVGIRYGGQLNRRGTWHTMFRADVAGFGLGSDLTWNVRLGFGYDFNDTVGLAFGYHWLDIDYDNDGLLFDILQQGPELGLKFSW